MPAPRPRARSPVQLSLSGKTLSDADGKYLVPPSDRPPPSQLAIAAADGERAAAALEFERTAAAHVETTSAADDRTSTAAHVETSSDDEPQVKPLQKRRRIYVHGPTHEESLDIHRMLVREMNKLYPGGPLAAGSQTTAAAASAGTTAAAHVERTAAAHVVRTAAEHVDTIRSFSIRSYQLDSIRSLLHHSAGTPAAAGREPPAAGGETAAAADTDAETQRRKITQRECLLRQIEQIEQPTERQRSEVTFQLKLLERQRKQLHEMQQLPQQR